MQKITVNENIAYQRLDRFLRKYFGKGFALSFIYKMLRSKKITVNGKKAQPKYMLELNDVIELYINMQDTSFLAQKQKNKANSLVSQGQKFESAEIVYEDDYLLIINKKAGEDLQRDLIPKLRGYLQTKRQDDFSFRPAFVHRLDKGTSGLLIAAKTNLALKKMTALFRQRKIAKYYTALLSQKIRTKAGVIKLNLQKTTIDGQDNQVVVCREAFNKSNQGKDKKERKTDSLVSSKDKKLGKETITQFKKIKDYGAYSLVSILLKTGFKHQIRVHFGHRGWGLVGDNKYGNKDINSYFYNRFKLKHQFLVATKVEFVHPFTGQKVVLGVALPEELGRVLEGVRL